MLSRLFRAKNSGALFALALFLGYCVLPIWIMVGGRGSLNWLLPVLAAVSAGIILTVTSLPFGRKRVRFLRVALDLNVLLIFAWIPFVAFVAVAFLTADKLPIIAAINGMSAGEIAVLREKFLKAREGWQSMLVYINAMLTGALIPYTLSLMFLNRMRLRWLFFLFFVFYCVSFMEKAFFLKCALPFLYLVIQKKIRTPFKAVYILTGVVGLLLAVTFLSMSRDAEPDTRGNYYSMYFIPRGPFEHLTWRSVVVPLLTASDALDVFEQRFGGQPLHGATSSLLAAGLGMERVPFERLVFEWQWGQNETSTGSANSVFLTEAFVNFGYVGVVFFSILIALIFLLFQRSEDEAFRSLWVLFAFGLYNAGLIGLLLSNGFLLLFLLAFFIKIRVRTKKITSDLATPHHLEISPKHS